MVRFLGYWRSFLVPRIKEINDWDYYLVRNSERIFWIPVKVTTDTSFGIFLG